MTKRKSKGDPHAKWKTERPILFSGPMVVKINRDEKDVTRRLAHADGAPYAKVGDTLWVRETWRAVEREVDNVDGVLFAADNAFIPIANTRVAADAWVEAYDNGRHRDNWRPAIFMPRWACRTKLKVISVRREKLHDIDDADARREGVSSGVIPASGDHPALIGYVLGDDDKKCTLYPSERDAFAAGWDLINEERCPWKDNPDVWRVEFVRYAP